MTQSATASVKGFEPIFERLLDDAAFLWLQRSHFANHPEYFPSDIADLDKRIANHLRALLHSPETVWQLFDDAGDIADAGYYFVAAYLAFHTANEKKIFELIERAAAQPEYFAGVAAALASLPKQMGNPWIKRFLLDDDRNRQYLALSACRIRCINPRDYLNQLLDKAENKEHESLYACALRLAAQLKRQDLFSHLQAAAKDERESVQFWSAWGLGLFRQAEALPSLQKFALVQNEWQQSALAVLFLLLEKDAAQLLTDQLARETSTARLAIEGCEWLGDPTALPWLLKMIRSPETNRAAAQAIISITGAVIENDWVLAEPQDMDDLPIVFDDHQLPFIEPSKLEGFFHRNRQRWVLGQRYFYGEPVAVDHFKKIYKNGNQRQRLSAALHLAMASPDQPLVNHAFTEIVV